MKLYKRGEIWWAEHWDGKAKKKIRVSTGETDKSKAQKVMLEQYAPIWGADKADKLAVAAGIVKAEREKILDEKNINLPLADAVLPTMKSENSNSNLRYTWAAFVRFCASKSITLMSAVSPSIIQEFTAGRKSNTVRMCVYQIRAVYLANGWKHEDLPQATMVGNDVDHHEPLSPDEIKRLLKAVDHPQRYSHYNEERATIVRVMLYTGLRVGDAITLRGEDLDLNAKMIKRRMQKTKKTVEFPIHPSLLKCLPTTPSGYLFPLLAGDGTARRIASSANTIRAAFVKCGLSSSPHCLRATFATLAVENDVPLYLVQSWLGHGSPMVTRIYARYEDRRKKAEAVARMPDFG